MITMKKSKKQLKKEKKAGLLGTRSPMQLTPPTSEDANNDEEDTHPMTSAALTSKGTTAPEGFDDFLSSLKTLETTHPSLT